MESNKWWFSIFSVCILIGLFICLALFALSEKTGEPFENNIILNRSPSDFIEAYSLAHAVITEWNPNSDLQYASWIAQCEKANILPERMMFSFVSTKKNLFSERKWLAHVWVDSRSQLIEVSAVDLTKAGPPDGQTYPEQLNIVFEDAIEMANVNGGEKYINHNPGCIVRVWLQEDVWNFDFDPSEEQYREDLTILVNGKSGELTVTNYD